jgi:hypothetical protein
MVPRQFSIPAIFAQPAILLLLLSAIGNRKADRRLPDSESPADYLLCCHAGS